MSIKGKLVSFCSLSGYTCKGIMYDVEDPLGTVIHVHGSYGNFYDNVFIQEMAELYNMMKLNLLAFNMETHGALSDGFKDGVYSYYGGAISLYDTSLDDIGGAIKFVSPLGGTIILQGHSQGTDKVLNYLWKEKKRYPAILLSPCDSYRLQELWIEPERVEEQADRIRSLPDKEFSWLDIKEYGIKSGGENYYIPITKAAFLSLVDGFNFRGFRYENEEQYFHLDGPVFIYIGGKDPFQTSEHSTVERFFKKRIKSSSFHYYSDGNHDMDGIVGKVMEDILLWIESI